MSLRQTAQNGFVARIEPFLLFLVFYLPAYLAQSDHLSGRIFNSVTFNLVYLCQALPRIALLLYLIVLRTRLEHPTAPPLAALRHYGLKRLHLIDIGWAAGALVLIELVLIPLGILGGVLTASGISLGADRVQWRLTSPAVLPLVFVTSMAAGYSEELYFRAYWLTALPRMGVSTATAVATGTLLFSLGHLYEGLIGFVGTAAIGVILSLIYLRRRNAHAIAVAHGLYNFTTLLATLAIPAIPF